MFYKKFNRNNCLSFITSEAKRDILSSEEISLNECTFSPKMFRYLKSPNAEKPNGFEKSVQHLKGRKKHLSPNPPKIYNNLLTEISSSLNTNNNSIKKILIDININSQEKASIQINPTENPKKIIQDFSKKYHLDCNKKKCLENKIYMILNNLELVRKGKANFIQKKN